jgi:glucose/arabinose dehydrogenase/PKD repeat protein
MRKCICPFLVAFGLGWLLFAQLGALRPTRLAFSPVLTAQEQAHGALPTAAAAVPPGFTLSLFADGLALPTDMVFLPNGDLLVAEKGGYRKEVGTAAVRLVHNGKVREQPVVVLGVNADGDSGLLGLTIDPDFTTNGYFYVWYATGSNSIGWTGQPTNRLARLTYNHATGNADLSSHQIVLEGVTWHEWHNGGGLAFGPDGLLYISTGDADIPEEARNAATLNGKVLRIQLTTGGYMIPPDNPYVNVAGTRPEVYAVGLRNPFRTFLHAGDNTLYVADVGQKAWEEINRLDAPGLNFGWNLREGPCYLQSDNCAPAAGLRDPYVSYRHDDGSTRSGAAIGGITAYTGSAFPAEYRNRIFFTDFTRQWLAVDDISAAAGFRVIGTRLGGINDMEQNRNALYLLDVERGAVWELRYTASDNQAPSAALAVSATAGKPPFAIIARAEQVNDPDDLVLTYHWDFGDGVTQETEEAQTSHTYAADGTYTLRLQVVDGHGAASTAVQERITVYSGEFPTITLENLTTPGLDRFRAGDAIRYTATRASGSEGLRAEDPYLWSVELHHNEHKHPFLSDVPTISGVYTMPVESHGDTDIFYRFGLSMFSAAGQEIAVYRDLGPDLITMTLDAEPHAAAIMWLDGGAQPAPAEVQTVIGTQHSLEAAEVLVHAGNVYSFTHWLLDGAPPVATRAVTITVPANPPEYVAHYLYARPADFLFLPSITR